MGPYLVLFAVPAWMALRLPLTAPGALGRWPGLSRLMFVALVLMIGQDNLGWTREPSSDLRLLIGGGIAAALCFLLHAMLEFTWQIPANAVVFLLIMSWISAQTAKA